MVRLNVRRLVKVLCLSFIVPIGLAWVVDIALGSVPVVTIAAIVIFIPAGAFFVLRATLKEFDNVVESVAPREPEVREKESG